MPPEIKKEVRDIIDHEADEEELSTDMMTTISLNAFNDVWDAPENEQWDEFIKKRLNV